MLTMLLFLLQRLLNNGPMAKVFNAHFTAFGIIKKWNGLLKNQLTKISHVLVHSLEEGSLGTGSGFLQQGFISAPAG